MTYLIILFVLFLVCLYQSFSKTPSIKRKIMRLVAAISSIILISVFYLLHGYFTDIEKCSQTANEFYGNKETLCYGVMNINSSVSAKKNITIQSFKIIDSNRAFISSTVGDIYELDYINGEGMTVSKMK